MTPIQRLFRPLQTALQVFFARDLALRRGEAGVEIVLTDRKAAAKPRKPTRSETELARERAELALMHEQLSALLDDLPETRGTLRHLVFVEQTLSRKGWRALHKLPLDVLQRALEQLEGLVQNWSPEGLANLRSKMAVAIIDREHMDPNAEADAYRTAMPMEAPPPEAGMAGDDAGGADDAALAAAYAAALGSAAPTPAPTPAALAAQALAQVQASAQATLAASAAAGPGEPLEFHNELGSPAARAQPRENLAGRGKLPPIKLRELQG